MEEVATNFVKNFKIFKNCFYVMAAGIGFCSRIDPQNCAHAQVHTGRNCRGCKSVGKLGSAFGMCPHRDDMKLAAHPVDKLCFWVVVMVEGKLKN